MGYYCRLFGRSRQGWYEQTHREEEQQMAGAIVLKLVKEIRQDLPKAGVPKLYHMLEWIFRVN